MSVFARVAVLSLVIVFLASAPVFSAAEPGMYGSLTAYAGSGKHPKSGVSGLIIDSRAAGLKYLCYSYQVTTSARIQGQISGTAERISDDGRVEKLATFSKTNIQKLPPGEPPPIDDPCAPEIPEIEGNFGVAADCVEIMTALDADDVIRWRFKFKRAPKLQGPNAGFTMFGSVLPMGVFSARAGQAQRAGDWAQSLGLLHLLDQ